MIYLSRSIRALPDLPSPFPLPPIPPLSLALARRDRGTEEEGDEGITWALVKQLNGPPSERRRERKKARGKEGGTPVRVKWLKKSLRLNGASKRCVFPRQFVGMIVAKITAALFRVLHLDQSTFSATVRIVSVT